jgi:hypothetical protein
MAGLLLEDGERRLTEDAGFRLLEGVDTTVSIVRWAVRNLVRLSNVRGLTR